MDGALIVLCTCPSEEVAEALAGGLVEARLAACVNILPQIRSIYRWEGQLHNDAEALMVIKTRRDSYPELESWLEREHPYDVPEVLALAPERGSQAYVDWLLREAGPG